MFIALQNSTETIVSGFDVLGSAPQPSRGDSFRCVLCDGEVAFRNGEDRFDFFTHVEFEDQCFERPGNSHLHQTACEAAVMEFCSKLGCDRNSVDVEKRVTNRQTWTTADVRILEPEPIVIEVYYRCRHCSLRRKLETLLNNGYAVYVICIQGAEYKPTHTPEDFNSSLRKIGPVEAGTYRPDVNELSVGSRITSELVDLDSDSVKDGEYDYILKG
ncbi:competence protein CoiA family protein [Haloferax volcanii]|uniref:hypothetical protein n=1 Tax=Haloferax volcanii TaxID=2246 RepID=UPI0038520282